MLSDIFSQTRTYVFMVLGPCILADGDDTAKTVLTLNLLGRPTSPEQMISYFKGDSGHLRTFHRERDPSPSVNCNGLMAILWSPGVDRYLPHIENITHFLCNTYLPFRAIQG